jgi:small subunit ribosomal protein S18
MAIDSRPPRRNQRPGTRFFRKKYCEFTKLGIVPDYKDVARLKKYITPNGKILPRRRSGLSAKMQRRVTIAIKRARYLALLPFVSDASERQSTR